MIPANHGRSNGLLFSPAGHVGNGKVEVHDPAIWCFDAASSRAEWLDRAHYVLTLARLTFLDWLAGPLPETPTDRAIREEGEQLRRAFPTVDFDHPDPKAPR